jgi:hypothetical protein
MATQTTTVSGDIPAVLEPFYVGERGLLERGVQQIFQPFEQRYAPVIQQGLYGGGADCRHVAFPRTGWAAPSKYANAGAVWISHGSRATIGCWTTKFNGHPSDGCCGPRAYAVSIRPSPPVYGCRIPAIHVSLYSRGRGCSAT